MKRSTYNPKGSQGAAVWQPQRTHRWLNLGQPSRLVHTTRDQKLWPEIWEGYRFLGVGGNRSARRMADMESTNQIHIHPLHCLWSSVPSWYRSEIRPTVTLDDCDDVTNLTIAVCEWSCHRNHQKPRRLPKSIHLQESYTHTNQYLQLQSHRPLHQ